MEYPAEAESLAQDPVNTSPIMDGFTLGRVGGKVCTPEKDVYDQVYIHKSQKRISKEVQIANPPLQMSRPNCQSYVLP